MQENQWQKIEEIFNRAVALPLAERQRFVEEICRDDAELCREILLLINADDAENVFFDEPVFALGAQILDADELLPEDSEFASYRIKKLLGRGGMGAVYLAEDARLGRPVALKILPSTLGVNTESVMRFRQEARAASAISHQNVAHIYEFGDADEKYFLAMEYVEGKTLRELLKENSIDISHALEISKQIADALAATHKRGIVHRDIKPENVMLTESSLVKVLDFGLAKLNAPPQISANDEKTLASLETIPGMIIGTTAYMSPEQVRGQMLDERSDLWSLGVVMFEMLAGKRPFAGATPSDIQAAILLKDAPLIELPTVTATVVGKLLKKDLAERYQSIEEFLPDLRRVKNEFETTKTSGKDSVSDINFVPLKPDIERGFFSKSSFPKLFLPLILFLAVSFSAIYFNGAIRQMFSANAPTAQNKKINSLVVLPFQNMSGDAQFDYVSAGLAEDLTRNLGKLNVVRVTAFASALKVRDAADLGEIRERLQVDSVVRGKIEKQVGKLIVSVEFLDANSGAVIWQDSISAGENNLLKLRDSLAVLLSTNLQSNFGGTKNLVVAESSTQSEAAYRAYLAGRFAPDRNNLAGTKRAIENLERAVALDANFAQAFVALAESYNLIGSWYGEKPEIYLPKAKAAVEKALSLDESSAEAHTILAKMKMDKEHDWTGCEREFKRAIELNPNYALAHHWFGEVYLSAMGRYDESLRELEMARQLNPLSSGIMTALAWTYLGKKDYEKAIEMCDEALQINSSDDSAYSYKSMALMKLGRYDEAIEIAKKSSSVGDMSELGVIYGLSGRTTEVREMLSQMEKKADASPYNRAVIYASIGEKDRAFELLEKQLKTNSVDLLSIKLDPLLDSLRDDARFAEIERKLNFPANQQK